MKAKKIEVHWEDHHEKDGTADPTDPKHLKPVVWETRGYLVSDNGDMIEVSRDITKTPDTYSIGAPVRIMTKNILYRSDKKS